MTIWKYALQVGKQEIDIPVGAEVLTAQNKDESICIWVKLDKTKPKTKRVFRVTGTGNELISGVGLKYIGTVQLDHGKSVFHVFKHLDN